MMSWCELYDLFVIRETRIMNDGFFHEFRLESHFCFWYVGFCAFVWGETVGLSFILIVNLSRRVIGSKVFHNGP